MKKLSTIIMALALVLGMSQCKKQEITEPATPNANPGVRITVNVGENENKDGKDDNGEKHNIAPAYGLFSFSSGDKLYVGHKGKFVGTLKFKNGFFDGTIYPDASVTDQQPLHFYFLGNSELKSDTIVDQTTSLSISIADQSGNLPVLSYGASNELYTGPNTTYSTTLKNKCALVRFNLLTETTDAITLSNVPTEATIDFVSNAITPTNTTGDITLYGEEGVETHRWAILLPETVLSGRDDLIWQGGGEGMPSIGNNTYVNAGIGEGIQIQNQAAVALPNADLVIKNSSDVFSEFTVSSTGKKVYFSKANLTWNSTAGYHFHDTQLDEEHSGGSSISNFDYTTTLPASGDQQQTNLTGLDRFTWGHIPNQSINSSYYLTNNQMAMEGLDPEWGKQMTGEGNDQWRTLTADEWNYLLHKRSGNRFMLVSVLIPCTYKGASAYTNIPGLLLFPDNFDYSGLGLTQAANANKPGFWPGRINTVYAASSSYTPASGNYTVVYDDNVNAYSSYNVYRSIEPVTDLEHLYTNQSSNMYKLLEAGCVFLPAVGCREGAVYKKYLYYQNRNNAAQGFYWTSDPVTVGTQEKANYFWFGYVGGSNVETDPRPTFDADNTQYRDLGCCVRLVWDAN